MGILDDAIREHLDLKRRQGADQDELARLEDEAFGPPSRPGDPEFQGADAEAQGAQVAETAAATEAPPFLDQDADEDSDALEGIIDDEPEAEVSEEAPIEDAAVVPGEATVEHDTLAEEDESGELDLDIELQIDEEIEDGLDLDEGEAEVVADDQPEAAAPQESAETIESHETVEHHFEDALDEAEVVEGDGGVLAEDSDDEDVLEETPEFLRDAPEDDELWFEQGEPKDFDF